MHRRSWPKRETFFKPEWNEPDAAKKSRSVAIRRPLDVMDSETWKEANDWLVQRAWELRRAFA